MKKLGLIGQSLDHSFSKRYFTEKFSLAGVQDWSYELYPLDTIDALPDLIAATDNLVGLNVTIPYKKAVLKYLQTLDPIACQIGAVNTIAISSDKRLRGYNTDAFGFKKSLLQLLGKSFDQARALVLGTGGASQAVLYVLKELHIPFRTVSRSAENGILYSSLNEKIIKEHRLIINCTPLGTYPNVNESPDLPFQYIGAEHALFDLVYNPQKSLFLQSGESRGARILNGASMLKFQAEAAWDIWKNK